MTNETTARTFTRGPWREYDRNDMGDIYLCDETGLAVAIVLEASIPTVAGRTEAIALAISAMPDLLEALQSIAMGFGSRSALAGSPLPDWTFTISDEQLKAADAAIAKALGSPS